MNRYFYTFGSDAGFPYHSGWVEVLAEDWNQAHTKFRSRFPDRHENIINCAFFYDEKKWGEMNPETNWPGWKCFEVIK